MKKCLIIPDSFKGTVSAQCFCNIAAEELSGFFPGCQILKYPIADGGEGTADCFLSFDGYEKISMQSVNPFMEKQSVYYARRGDTAVIELARCAGLTLAAGRKNPLITTTYGTGLMIKHAVENGCKHIVLGLGGSCTNDGGTGIAAALGAQFTDKNGHSFLPSGGSLEKIHSIDISRPARLLEGVKITAMCDIDNPLCGENGAARIFAPQKGADRQTVKRLDAGLAHLAYTIKKAGGGDLSDMPGAGAAGGAGFGVACLLGGQLKRGIDLVLDMAEFEKNAAGADCIITGEGCLDSQSLGGKAVVGIARRAKKLDIPVIAVVGQALPGYEKCYDEGVSCVFTTNMQAVDFTLSKPFAKQNLRAALSNAARLIKMSEKFGR